MSASIVLCAGKGTRMNDDSKNKVAFNLAGVPVIKRLVNEMRKGGVNLFVIVVGHNAESVKEALSGEEGIIYAYQCKLSFQWAIKSSIVKLLKTF